MVNSKKKLQLRNGCYASILAVVCSAFLTNAKTDVPVFLLSGQSNMTGYATFTELSADQKKSVENAKIYLDLADWEGVQSKKRTWLTVGTGFGADKNGNNIGPELFLARTLSEAMPGQKIALVKNCEGSTYLGKAEDWLPPSSNNGTGGTNYQNMMNTIDVAIKAFTTAFDTAQYTPRWAGFVWLQGEFDGQDQTLSNAYEKNLTNLIKDIRAKLNAPNLPVIIPMIDVQSSWKYNSIIRAADVAVKQKSTNVDTLDTKGFPTDNVHYKGLGQVKIGTVAAQRWLNMKYSYGPTVSVVYKINDSQNTTRLQTTKLFPDAICDLTGRKITIKANTIKLSTLHQRGVYITIPNK